MGLAVFLPFGWGIKTVKQAPKLGLFLFKFEIMSIIRVGNFGVKIPKQLITDKNLSDTALRIILYLYTKPTDFVVSREDIMKELGINSANTYAKKWREINRSGWVSIIKGVDENGRFTGCNIYQLNYKGK